MAARPPANTSPIPKTSRQNPSSVNTVWGTSCFVLTLLPNDLARLLKGLAWLLKNMVSLQKDLTLLKEDPALLKKVVVLPQKDLALFKKN